MSQEHTFDPCPFCGEQPVTDPNRLGYYASAAWLCGTVTLWPQQGKTRQSERCELRAGNIEAIQGQST